LQWSDAEPRLRIWFSVIASPKPVSRARSVPVMVTVACALALAVPGAGEERVIDTERSALTVRVFKSGLFRAFADDHVIQAPLLEGSLDEPAHVQIIVDARRMRVVDPGLSPKDRQDVQTRMLGPDVLDVDRFPQIRFHSVAIQRLESGRWRVEGELELHGQIHRVTVDAAMVDGHYKGSTSVRQTAFGITPIRVAGGTVKVKDDVQVDFDIVAAER
jgi:YceI-like domain